MKISTRSFLEVADVFLTQRILLPLGSWIGPTMIAATGIVMLWWSWRKWPDVLIDFGRELYVPWQLASGSVLYVDVAYFNGPFSPYLNSLWFRLFGTSLTTLVLCNLLILAISIGLFYAILSRIATRFAATAGCLGLVTLFAFGQYTGIGNYNFICPYSHELTHGILLSLSSLFCLSLYQKRKRLACVAGAGFFLGLLFLTKIEVFISGTLAAGAWLCMTLWAEAPDRRRASPIITTLIGSAILPSACAFIFFSFHMPVGSVLREPLGYWMSASRSDLVSLPYFSYWSGMDDVSGNLMKAAVSTIWYLVVFAPIALAGLWLRKSSKSRSALGIVFSVIFFGVLLYFWRDIRWFEAARPLPLFILILAGLSFVQFVRAHRNHQSYETLILRISMIVFSFGMLLKMILNARIYHYGFALALPATLLLIVALLDWLPDFLSRLGWYAPVFRGAAVAALLVAVFAHLQIVNLCFGDKPWTVSQGADSFLADDRAPLVNQALQEIGSRAKNNPTLAVLPEGVMINYLLRLKNPTPYIFLNPFDVMLFGEERILSSFGEHSPDFVALVHRDTSEYGFRFFGQDYGQRIYSWIMENYQEVKLIGDRPFRDDNFGILLLQRRSSR